MHVLDYCLFLYSRHNLNKRQNFSNSRCKLGFFQYIFYQYSIIWIQLTFYFLDLVIRWSILGSTFLPKSLYISRGVFFCISRNICWGERGWKWAKMKIIQIFFALIEDFGCSFKLNFDGRGAQMVKKVKIQQKIA
jgi:hypothetical protein